MGLLRAGDSYLVVTEQAPHLPKPSVPLETLMTDVIQGATATWVLSVK